MQFGSLSPSCFIGMKRGKLYAREGSSIENRTIQNEPLLNYKVASLYNIEYI